MSDINFSPSTPVELALQNRVRELERKLHIYEVNDRALSQFPREPVVISSPQLPKVLTLPLTAKLVANVTPSGVVSVLVEGRSGDQIVSGQYSESTMHQHSRVDAMRHAGYMHEQFMHSLSDVFQFGKF